jgi:hypothetical protein
MIKFLSSKIEIHGVAEKAELIFYCSKYLKTNQFEYLNIK